MQFDTSKLRDYLTNDEIEATVGVWCTFGGDIEMRLLRAGGANKAYTRSAQNGVKPYRRQIDQGTMDVDQTMEVMREVYSRTIVKEWRGVLDMEGEPVPCTPQNVRDFFMVVPELFQEVIDRASSLATFADQRAEEAEETLGN